MRKILLFMLSGMLAMPTFAQEEDVTHYIVNPGFDEDLTFQVDGTMKEATSTSTSLSDRSWAYIAADSTVYARPKQTSSQKRPDGRKMEAINGFKGRVKGWTLESNADFPKCEWTYFGTVPYDLQGQSVPVADDGSTYLEVPARPDAYNTPDNVGFVYLRAGWTNSAIYKQVVKLPCAKYRLEYWTININPNTSSEAKDLTKIICRKEEAKDESGIGLSAQEWTKHSFTFIPTSAFTMQFGYEAANAGSGGQPIVALDGIKLYKIGEADPMELIQSDLNDLIEEASAFAYDTLAAAQRMSDELMDAVDVAEDALSSAQDTFDIHNAIVELTDALNRAQQGKEALDQINILMSQVESLKEKNYPGLSELETVAENMQITLEEGNVEEVLAAEKQLKEAINTYILSQEASDENPADYTALYVQNPWFIQSQYEPTLAEDGTATYPNNTESNTYNNGSSNADFTSEGWYIGASGGDQRLNFAQNRSCWNAWSNNFTDMSINQDIVGLKNGYYKVSADLITQAGFAGYQHAFATSTLEEGVSENLAVDNWADDNTGAWTTLTTTKVLVYDGKLTIGAATHKDTNDGTATGWFCATNFKLLYCGEATQEQIDAAIAKKTADAEALAASMHFAADKASVNDSIAAYKAGESIDVLNGGIALAKASEAKYTEIMGEEKTIPTVKANLADPSAYYAARPIVEFADAQMDAYLASAEATYNKIDSIIAVEKAYVNDYADAFNKADEKQATSKSAKAVEAIKDIMAKQLEAMTKAPMKSTEEVAALVSKLNEVLRMAELQEQYESAVGSDDLSQFIKNADAAATDGWVINKGEGNTETGSGQYWDSAESSHRYFDSYNSTAGKLNYFGYQIIKGVPNGTYTVGVDARTSGHGAYIFAGTDTLNTESNNVTWLEIPLQTYQVTEDSVVNATDVYGQIWADAKAAYDENPTLTNLATIVTANGSKGFGWERIAIENIVVTDHQIVIGMTTDSLRTQKAGFTGTWFSATNWTLTKTADGDNTGWDGPLSGLEDDDVLTGDADGDGEITVNDVTFLVDAILGNEGTGFNAAAADVDGDGEITVNDATTLVGKILGITNAKSIRVLE